jgi:hypothetical protein
MPLSGGAAQRQAVFMDIIVTGDPLVLRQSRLTDRLLARLRGASLDRQIAVGTAPESSVLLAERARQLVAIERRRRLSENWAHLLRIAPRLQGTRHPARPIPWQQVLAAEAEIRELVRGLAAPLPVAARGVAMATVLLTDAGSPLYNRRSPVPLAAALAAVTEQLDPGLSLVAS